MGPLASDQAFARFMQQGYNSSHSVWFLMGLEFFESSSGWVFALRLNGATALLPLDPLYPSTLSDAEIKAQFQRSLMEVVHFYKISQVLFVSVYSRFANLLRSFDFQILQIGEEPWVDLKDPLPKGNSGKGVRSARNYAIKAGITIETWDWSAIQGQSRKMDLIRGIRAQWRSRKVFQLNGFLNTIDEFAHPECRRYFVAQSPTRVEGVLIATRIPGINSYYLEDTLLLPDATKGTGELLTTEAMRYLELEGATQASLGVISMATMGASQADLKKLPWLVRLAAVTIPATAQKFVNFNGINVFRKRFKPTRNESVFVAFRNFKANSSDTWAWVQVGWELLWSFEPKLRFSLSGLAHFFGRYLKRYPVALSVTSLIVLSFLYCNVWKGTDSRVSANILNQFAFMSSAPLSQWWYRSLLSDYIFFDRLHFFTTGSALIFVLLWAERKHKPWFVLWTLLAVSLVDDIINYGILIKPFQYMQPSLFHRLVAEKDVGCSLSLALFSGLMICQFRRAREPVFVLLSLSIVLTYAYSATRLPVLIINLNHLVFFYSGYLLGKVRFEMGRSESRKAAKGKSPELLPISGPLAPASKARTGSEENSKTAA